MSSRDFRRVPDRKGRPEYRPPYYQCPYGQRPYNPPYQYGQIPYGLNPYEHCPYGQYPYGLYPYGQPYLYQQPYPYTQPVPSIPQTGACPQGALPYTVQSGDTLDNIASRLGISTDAIITVNPGVNFSVPLQNGQSICLPAENEEENENE